MIVIAEDLVVVVFVHNTSTRILTASVDDNYRLKCAMMPCRFYEELWLVAPW